MTRKSQHLSLEARAKIGAARNGQRNSPATQFKRGLSGRFGKDNPSTWPKHKAALSRGQKRRYAGHKVAAICPQCEGTFIQFLSDKLRGHRFCSRECFSAWQEQHTFKKWRATRVSVDCLYCGKSVKVAPSIAKVKKFCSIRCRNRWDSEHVTPNIHLARPNKAELKLGELLEKYFPGDWEYTGDGAVILKNLIPDYTNKNGRKAVIELFGEYWHTKMAKTLKDTEIGKIMAYKSLGFKCLVIWMRELKNEHEVVEKIKNFFYAEGKSTHIHIK